MDVTPLNYDLATREQRYHKRNEYVQAQKGLCLHCKTPLNSLPAAHIMLTEIDWRLFPAGFRNHPVHLHHDHNNGLTIGAVHMRCNAVLWQYYGE